MAKTIYMSWEKSMEHDLFLYDEDLNYEEYYGS